MTTRCRATNLVGLRFGKWEALRYEGGKDGLWECRCDCGHIALVRGGHLRSGASTQCKSCATSAQLTTHGLSRTNTYRIYQGMLARCYNESRPEFKNYGGRGIQVCEHWRDSFERFLDDMGERPSKRHLLERIDNDADYDKDNCCWATWDEQARNKRSNRWLEHNGERMILKDWAARLGITQQALLGRLAKGWDIDKALSTPHMRRSRYA